MPGKSIEELARELRSWRPSHFRPAAQALGEGGDPGAEAALAAALLDCLSGSLVYWHRASRFQAIAAALVAMGSTRAMKALIDALTDADPLVRGAAVDALSRLPDPLAVGPLLRIVGEAQLVSDEPAAQALTRLGHGMMVPVMRALREYYGLGVPYWANKAARAAGALLSDDAAVAFLADERALETLIRALESADANAGGRVRRRVLDAWVALGPEIAQRLLRLVQHEGPIVPLWAAEALGRLDLPGMADPLLDILARGEARCRTPAAIALGFMGRASALPLLLRALATADDVLVRAAAAALGPLGAAAAEALEPLRRCRDGTRDNQVWHACRDSIRQIEAGLRTAPAELESAPPPEGRGTELESTPAPAGRGTELESTSGPADRGG